MFRRVLCALLIVVLVAGFAGCHHVDQRYWGFQLSADYEDWAESENLLVFYPLLNPFWLIGILILALDFCCAPVTFIHDLVIYLAAEPGSIPAPWDVMEARRWSTPGGR